jgi:large subunit ribosomal protein L10
MKTKGQKKQEVEVLSKKMPDSKITVFTSFSQAEKGGLSVAQLQQLRRALREKKSEYLVSKKTLTKRVLNASGFTDVDPREFEGSLGVVFGYEDPIETAKSVYDFAKQNNALVVHGALFEDNFIDAARFTELAQLPGREVLLGRTLGMLQYPISGLASVLQGNIRNLLLILKNIKK